jgi:LPS O-antigen subunit length determinant protein (WzzB/FepE family)
MSKAMLASVRQDYAFRTLDPALPPDVDAYVKPMRALIVALGLLLGGVLGTGFVLLRGVLRSARKH